MPKPKIAKSKLQENIDSFQPSILWEQKTVDREACIYRVNRVLSDTPPGATPEDYPYHTVSGGVMLNSVFKSIFPKGKIPVMPKHEADRLCAMDFGFDKKSGYPCRIFKNENKIKIVVYPENGTPYTMDCFTGLRAEK